jgi:hypothetical protein
VDATPRSLRSPADGFRASSRLGAPRLNPFPPPRDDGPR